MGASTDVMTATSWSGLTSVMGVTTVTSGGKAGTVPVAELCGMLWSTGTGLAGGGGAMCPPVDGGGLGRRVGLMEAMDGGGGGGWPTLGRLVILSGLGPVKGGMSTTGMGTNWAPEGGPPRSEVNFTWKLFGMNPC